MAIGRLAVAGYRSLRDLRLSLDRLTIVTGPNGSGKSSLYRALRLLADCAQGRVIASLAREGGFGSALWAGPETIGRGVRSGAHPVQGTARRNAVALRLGFSDDEYGYAIDLGLPVPVPGSVFFRDPEIKVESVWTGPLPGRANVVAERRNALMRLRDRDGIWREVPHPLAPFDSLMTHGADPRDAPEVVLLRERMRGWRFYDHLRTDPEAPARRPQVGTRTPVLAGDGSDLAAALRTIIEIGDEAGLARAVDDAFPGTRLDVAEQGGQFALDLHQPGLLRPLKGAELSDGTLRYLLLAAALLTPRPPDLMVLNEPETSLHADLIGPLARLIAGAARHAQIIVVTHAPALADALAREPGAGLVTLEKSFGETAAVEHDPPSWVWAKR